MDENRDSQTPGPEETPQPEESAAPQTPSEPETSAGQTSPPAAAEADNDTKMWGMLCHLTALAGYIGVPFGNIVGPLVVWLIKRDEIPFVNDQGKESLNFQITVCICALIVTPTICLFPLYILLIAALGIANIVFVVMASIAANKGQSYRYPYAFRFIK